MDNLPVLKKQLSDVSIKKRFEEMLGKKAPGFISSIINVVNGNDLLAKADPQSIIMSAAVAATLDLPINPNLGFAYIVPYSGKAQFQMGYKGFIQLAMRTGQYKTINACEIYEGELKSFKRLTGMVELDYAAKTSETVIGYVAYFAMINGFEKMWYMTKEQIEAHGKTYSKSFSNANGRWKKDFHSMALKTVLKLLLSKYGFLSIDMQKAVLSDQGIVSDFEGDKIEFPDNQEAKSFDEHEEVTASSAGELFNEGEQNDQGDAK